MCANQYEGGKTIANNFFAGNVELALGHRRLTIHIANRKWQLMVPIGIVGKVIYWHSSEQSDPVAWILVASFPQDLIARWWQWLHNQHLLSTSLHNISVFSGCWKYSTGGGLLYASVNLKHCCGGHNWPHWVRFCVGKTAAFMAGAKKFFLPDSKSLFF